MAAEQSHYSANLVLHLQDLSVWRGERCLIDGLSLASHAPVLHIAGENGVGKTTLLKCLGGLTQPSSGQVVWQVQDQMLTARSAGFLLAWVGHQEALNPALTVSENLLYGVGLQRDISKQSLQEKLIEHDLAHLGGLPAHVLSAGQRRRVALLRAVMTEQAVWILDEPYANLDTQGRSWVDQLMHNHLQNGGKIVLSTHQPPPFDSQIMQTLELGL